ncbi:hypothetical protein FQN50_001544 [Emmonsiellopsis sp. PD_5]|nr:hypothetical protein FQN50_001544 [Emmonsiellopsis sp. PD_5]
MDDATNHLSSTATPPSSHQHPLTIRPVRNPKDLSTTISLFKTYTNALGIDLSYQDFDKELASMPGAYSPPHGELLLAVRNRGTSHSNDNDNDDGKNEEVVGCIALRPLYLTPNPNPAATGLTSTSTSTPFPTPPTPHSELKRLYVTPSARGLGVGKALVNAMLMVAREKGYGQVYLDTLLSMKEAIRMYKGMGFEEVEKYYEAAREGTVFLGLRL